MATSDAETLLIGQVRSGDASAWRLLIERYDGTPTAYGIGLRDHLRAR